MAPDSPQSIRPTPLPSTIPCLWPSPDRGRTIAHRPGSPIWMAMPLGMRAEAPASRRSGASIIARRSMPADAIVAYSGSGKSLPETRIENDQLDRRRHARFRLVRGRGIQLRDALDQGGRQNALVGLPSSSRPPGHSSSSALSLHSKPRSTRRPDWRRSDRVPCAPACRGHSARDRWFRRQNQPGMDAGVWAERSARISGFCTSSRASEPPDFFNFEGDMACGR